MEKLTSIFTVLGLATGLAGCNSTDALMIPPMDVGGGTTRSSPVTTADLDAMERQQPVVSYQTTPVSTRNLEPPSQTSAFAAETPVSTAQTQLAAAQTDYRDPPGSLEAQARQLVSNSREPAQTPAGRTGGQMPGPEETTQAEPLETPSQPQAATDTAALSAAPSVSGTIRFLPIIGAPVQSVTPLSRELGIKARANGLNIKSSTDQTTEHILKGYFSAFPDGGKTTVTFVWDVLDNNGNRLHRIQGQDSVANTAADPWAAVPAETMQRIGDKTIAEYMTWRASHRG